MANWDDGFKDYRNPSVPQPSEAVTPIPPVGTPSPAQNWDAGFRDHFQPQPEPQDNRSYFQQAKDFLAPATTGDFWKGTAYGLGQDVVKPMYALSRGIESLVPPSPGVKPASQSLESGYKTLDQPGSENFNTGRATGRTGGEIAEQALAAYLTRGHSLRDSGPVGAFLGAINTVPGGDDYGANVGKNALNEGLANAGTTGALKLAFPGPTKALQQLRAAGVEPTPGTYAGGIPSVMEGVLSKIPVLNSPINAGRASALNQFEQAGGKAVLPDVLPKMGQHDQSVMQWGPKLVGMEEIARHYSEPVMNYLSTHPLASAAVGIPAAAAAYGANSNVGRQALNPMISGMSGLLKYLAPGVAEQYAKDQPAGLGIPSLDDMQRYFGIY